MSAHEHCHNCFSRCCTETECPMVVCQFNCGQKFHECKSLDHGYICQNKKVPCINVYYGCPMVLARSQLASHIQNCPASVVHCTYEWVRKPVYSQERLRWVPFEQPNPVLVEGYLDVELALHDQKVVNKMVQVQYKQGVARKRSECHDSSLKLSYERAKSFRDEVKSAEIVANDLPITTLDLVERKKLVDNSISSPESDSDNCSMSADVDIPECPALPDTRLGLGLNVNIEMFPKFGRHSYPYMIPCGQVLQRREYPAHFKNVHNDVHNGLGWIERRCPMAQYGCRYVDHPLLPSSQNGSVVFNQILGIVGVRLLKTTESEGDCYLLCLPSELLEEICKWLDGFSLNNLMQTCRTLHNNLKGLLKKQGVVTMQWRKRIYEDGSASWTFGKKAWLFSKASSEIKKWVFSESPGLAAHFEKCPYFEKYLAKEPFQYVPNHPSVHGPET
ncbi:F-box only protein 30-like [Dendronephthya gigantea]|uniref:F-box only protein 30-like n=1 Tax=Dendronephthya gigantea TaxID=151771 RepID=UPI00106A1A10|nr:F-box only protein 30-like [Dendronephthya gigantea]